ncbi:TRAP transporter large permease [Synoicihabitans lomoniglobus]|uniref:TRAP transporter large permease n=1 Tax=Synoicihabitans lomoniglobus TaxID=2909285 RepID=A0AAE9ZVM3_9BACT|nr:TRAP transporter large permease [Opitutaceae bacterium LMO-M01]WED63278.1 TRAP transporter large permease [Opitutaceae bacterium LMO-M01]
MTVEVLVLLLLFVGLLVLNTPVAVCIGLAAAGTLVCIGGDSNGYIMAQRVSSGIASFPLLAIPFFVLAGGLMGEGGMARRLTNFAFALVGRLPGGLSYVNTLTCMMFGAVSGSAAAAVSSIGGSLIPEMEAKGYKREFAVALTATSATTGLLIPPSNIMIVYAVVAGNVSVAALFLAGVIPGIVIGLLIMGVSLMLTLRSGALKSASGEMAEIPPFGRALWGALPSLLLVIIVMGGILGGVFSATEASAIAVAYAFVLGVVVYREIALSRMPEILLRAAKTTAVVMLLVGTSQAMSWVLASERVPQLVSAAMIGLSDNPLIILLMINVLLLIVGTFMDMTPAVLIFTPIFLPVVTALGMDPVQFGIVLIANLCIGLCTPPVGACLFVSCSVGKTSIARVVPPMIPFFFSMLIGLLLITYWPALSIALPRWLGLM